MNKKRSKVMKGNESSHITSYLLLIVSIWLGSTILKIQAKMWKFWPKMPPSGHFKIQICITFWIFFRGFIWTWFDTFMTQLSEVIPENVGFDLSMCSRVKGHEGKWKFTYNFLSVVNSNDEAWKHHFEDTCVWKYIDLDMTFHGHPRSKSMSGNESSHTIWLPICW